MSNNLLRFLLTFLACNIVRLEAFTAEPTRNFNSVLARIGRRSSARNYGKVERVNDSIFDEETLKQTPVNGKESVVEDNEEKRRGGPNSTRRKKGKNLDSDGNQRGKLYEEECSILVDEMAESLDLTRETHRLESLSSYIVVSALTATASFASLQNLSFPRDTVVTFLAYNLGIAASCLSAISGMYATVVFSLCSTYGLTAIGMRQDAIYETFMQTTGSFRMKAFQAYMTSLSSFMVVLLIFLSVKLDEATRYPILAVFILLALLSWKDWTKIIEFANPIFLPPSDTEEE